MASDDTDQTSSTPTDDKEILTNSRAKTARACLRLEWIEYVAGYRPLKDAEALRVGTLLHQALEAWWWLHLPTAQLLALVDTLPATHHLHRVLQYVDNEPVPHDQIGPAWALGAALRRLDLVTGGVSPYEAVYVEELVRGYDRAWAGQRYQTVAVELQFNGPLVNPATGRSSTAWGVAGKLDVVARDLDSGALVFVEHKSAGVDISPGSTYWKRLRMDSQVSTYYDGAAWAGFDVQGCLYDVVSKPRIKPLTATPADERAGQLTLAKHGTCPSCKVKGGATTAPHTVPSDLPGGVVACGADYQHTLPDGEVVDVPGVAGKVLTDPPRYRAGVRWEPETIDQYRARVADAIAGNPGSYVRDQVARVEAELAEYRLDLWHLAASLREAHRANRHPRNPSACERWGRFCDYFDVCTGGASLDDPTRFKRLDRVHAELDPTPEEA